MCERWRFPGVPEPHGSRPCARRQTTHLQRRTAQGSRSPRSLQRLCCSWHTSILLAGPGSVVRSKADPCGEGQARHARRVSARATAAANRSAGPARPPVVPAAVPRPERVHAVSGLPPPTGPCPEGRTHGTTARRSITTRQGAAHESAARGTRFASGSPARWHPVYDRGQRQLPGIGQQPVTCTDSRCRQPSGVSAAVPRDRWQPARTAPARDAASPPPRARPRPEPAGQHPLPTRFLDRSSRTSPRCGFSRVHAQAPRQALSAPLSAPLPRGRGHCLAEPDPGLAWLASTSPEPATGRICVVTGNRAQPVTECVVCSQSPVTV